MTTLFENFEQGDLKDLVYPHLTIDQYRSKMGDDDDIVVVTYRVKEKEPAEDLVHFFEKGYDFVLDADVSSGPIDDLDYLVFVELIREPEVAQQIMKITRELCNLTNQDLEEWLFSHKNQVRKHDLTSENIQQVVPLTPEEYQLRTQEADEKMLESLKLAAGMPVNKTLVKNEFVDQLKLAAGIRL
jgi:hypothetical protein